MSLSGQYSSCYYRCGTNFVEHRQCEVRRISLLGTWVNNPRNPRKRTGGMLRASLQGLLGALSMNSASSPHFLV
jgi:hypothetical protein